MAGMIARSLLVSLLLAAVVAGQTTHYVDGDASGADDGTSWTDAYPDLQNALAVAVAGDKLHIAEGVHAPDQGTAQTPGDRSATFLVAGGVELRGGYAGFGEPDPDARDPSLYPTELSGDLLGDDLADFVNRGDNSYTVVTVPPGALTAVLNGLEIRGGQSDGTSVAGEIAGGGVFVELGKLSLVGCTITDCHADVIGGGVYASESTLSMTRCGLIGNRVIGPALDSEGGGLWAWTTHVDLFDCDVVGNTAGDPSFPVGLSTGIGGGVVLTWNNPHVATGSIRNCRFVDNVAVGFFGLAGGLTVTAQQGFPVTNSLFDGNLAETSDGLAAGGGAALAGCHVSACSFVGNEARSSAAGLEARGGGIVTSSTANVIESCVFSGNRADGGSGLGAGGGIESDEAHQIRNCSFANNWASHDGGGARARGGSYANCVLWDNTDGNHGSGERAQLDYVSTKPSVNYCDIEGLTALYGGTGNIGLNPGFAFPVGADFVIGTPDDNLRLSGGSPCIDAGDNAQIPADGADLDCDGDSLEPVPIDHDGHVRRFDDPNKTDTGAGTAPLVDMGAYEYLADLPTEQWVDLGSALAGTLGLPVLAGRGMLCPLTPVGLTLANARFNATAHLMIGVSTVNVFFKGGLFVPSPDLMILGLSTGPSGGFDLTGTWPTYLPSGFALYAQVWIEDPAGPVGFAASNAVSGTIP